MSDPISLRKIPPETLALAQELSKQTGLSINDVFRLALTSGLLIEITKVSPRPDGTLAGLPGASLAKALRRHLGSAIDLLLEYGEHPHQALPHGQQEEWGHRAPGQTISPGEGPEKGKTTEPFMGDDLEALELGSGLAEIVGG